MAVELTPEQTALLAEFEAEFASRYTDSDPDYRKVLEPSPPPIAHPWYGPRRNFDRRDRDRDRGRDGWRGKQRHDRHYNHHRHQPYHRYR